MFLRNPYTVVHQPICHNRPIDQLTLCLFSVVKSMSASQHFRKFQMPKCQPTTDRHNKLSANGRTMMEGCSTDYSTTVSTEETGRRRRKKYNLVPRTQNRSTDKKKGRYRPRQWLISWRLLPNNPIFASKTVSQFSIVYNTALI